MKKTLKTKSRRGLKKSGKKKYDFGGIRSKESAIEAGSPHTYLTPVNGFWAY